MGLAGPGDGTGGIGHGPHGLGRGRLVGGAPRFLGRLPGRRAPRRARRGHHGHPDGLPRGLDRSRPRPVSRGPLPPRLALPQPRLVDPEVRPARAGRLGREPLRGRSSRATLGTSRRRPCPASPSCTGARTRSSPPSRRATSRPQEVKEAALFNLSTLRTQTCSGTADGRFYGWEGCSPNAGCCPGIVHPRVELRAGDTVPVRPALARLPRGRVSATPTSEAGLMDFRVALPIGRAQEWPWPPPTGRWAASSGVPRLAALRRRRLPTAPLAAGPQGPGVRLGHGGWDADRDGVMEGCQHNTMDVEYYGPNPQMGLCYLGALRAAEEMAGTVGDPAFASSTAPLRERHAVDGRAPVERRVLRAPRGAAEVQGRRGRGPQPSAWARATDAARLPARRRVPRATSCSASSWPTCAAWALVDPAHTRETLRSIFRYNLQPDLFAHFNAMRAYAVNDESALRDG